MSSEWEGVFTGKESYPTVKLGAVADIRCRFRHFLFGLPGSLNDINHLDRSHLQNDMVNGNAYSVKYKLNGNEYSFHTG